MEFLQLIQQHKFTLLLGKNGAGKSTVLRKLDEIRNLETRYISPERGGTLKYEPNIEQNMTANANWLVNSRRRNRAESFRQQSASQFRSLEMLFLREIESVAEKRRDETYTFNRVIDDLNEFLPAIRLRRSDKGFSIVSTEGVAIDEDQISSGESEFIALAIEVLVYAKSQANDKLLLLDEPDVHLHPDLQAKFVEFLERVAIEANMRVVIATHSTALVSGFSSEADLQVVPVISRGQLSFESFVRSSVSDELLPIFGAHPLSTIFNRSPALLVEGEDDRRVVDQLVRSSNGRVKFSPCVVGTVTEMNQWEAWVSKILPVIYDNPRAFSLRDLDDSSEGDLDDVGCVVRLRLNCYAMENLLLSDEVLGACGHSVDSLKGALAAWIGSYPAHPYFAGAKYLLENFDERRRLKIKDVRNVLVALLGTNKPWEVLIGQVLASDAWRENSGQDSIRNYLGAKTFQHLFG